MDEEGTLVNQGPGALLIPNNPMLAAVGCVPVATQTGVGGWVEGRCVCVLYSLLHTIAILHTFPVLRTMYDASPHVTSTHPHSHPIPTPTHPHPQSS